MGPERATMALTFGKANSGTQGREGREHVRTERDTNENGDERERFKKATERVTECQGKNKNINIEMICDSTSATTEGMGQGGSQEERIIDYRSEAT